MGTSEIQLHTMSAETATVKCTVRGTEAVQRIHQSHPFLCGIGLGELCWHNLEWTNTNASMIEHNGSVQDTFWDTDTRSEELYILELAVLVLATFPDYPVLYRLSYTIQSILYYTVRDRNLERSLETRLVISTTHLYESIIQWQIPSKHNIAC